MPSHYELHPERLEMALRLQRVRDDLFPQDTLLGQFLASPHDLNAGHRTAAAELFALIERIAAIGATGQVPVAWGA